MTYRPTEFQINNSGAIGIDIRIDPESLVEQTMFFQIDQDSEGITVSLECLENIGYPISVIDLTSQTVDVIQSTIRVL